VNTLELRLVDVIVVIGLLHDARLCSEDIILYYCGRSEQILANDLLRIAVVAAGRR